MARIEFLDDPFGDLGQSATFDQSEIQEEGETLDIIYQGEGKVRVDITNNDSLDEVLEISTSGIYSDFASYSFYIGENANVKLNGNNHLTPFPATNVDSFTLANNSTLEISSEYISDFVKDGEVQPGVGVIQAPRINMGEGNNTLIYDDRQLDEPIDPQFEKIKDELFTKISGLTAGDKIIVPGAASGEYDGKFLNFYNGDGELLSKLDVRNNSEEALFQIKFDDGTMSIACFLKGTYIATPDGEVNVESLKADDKVLTANGTVATVKWLGYRTLHKTRISDKDIKRSFPVLFKKGCIADNIPTRDLFMSPGHHVFFDGNLVPAMALINGKSIVQQFHMKSFQYFHIELEQFDILLAEGVPAESYVDCGNRNMFQNAHEVAMDPDFGPAEGRPLIPGITVVRKGPVVEAIRAKLLERGNWMQVPDVQKRVG